MVHLLFGHTYSTDTPFSTRILEDSGFGMVYASDNVHHDSFPIRIPRVSLTGKKVSIVICTYGRPQSLNETLTSLTKQTFKDFEVILLTEKGDLSKLRDTGLRCLVTWINPL